MLSYAEMAAEVAEHLAAHDSHGYSQPNRAGDGTVETVTLSDGTQVRVHGGDYDCSELARTCYAAAGVLAWGYWDSYMWTGNADARLTANGFRRYPFSASAARRGDLLWKRGHMGVALGGGRQADAHGDEYGGLTGPNAGDQTGREVEARALQAGWAYIYRYEGPARPGTGGDAASGDGTAEKAQTTAQTGEEMICVIRPNGENYLEYFDGQKVHRLAHPDELEAIRKVYRATHGGADIPMFELGSKDAPWATRLHQALAR